LTVFTSGKVGQLEIKNHLVRSATYENAATSEGRVSDFLLDLYHTLAKGGVGLIITGAAAVYPRTVNGLPMRADDDSCIPSLARIPQVVHEADPDCRVMLQLYHPGRQVIHQQDASKLAPFAPRAWMAYILKHPESMALSQTARPLVEPTAPSAVYDTTFGRTPRALTLDEIERIVDAFADGVRRAQEAGFDGAQIHAAHGYLLSSFLSPRTNKREDGYGGSTENRTRIIREIHERARGKVGDNFPILIKMNTTDFLPGGVDLNETVRIGKVLSEMGFSAIEASGGMWEAVTRPQEELGWPPVLLPESRTGITNKNQEAYFLSGAKALKEETKMIIILVGGLRSLDRIEEIVNSKAVDFISMSRPLVRQPDLPNLWFSGNGPHKAECVSCNACLPVGNAPLVCRAKMQ
jgi:2,4-dienoyl-CoA reductase-like NADH-dependent reductase (Old Yellow Enzyme family)